MPGVSLAFRNLAKTDPGAELCRLSGVTFHSDVTAQFVLSARGHGIPVRHGHVQGSRAVVAELERLRKIVMAIMAMHVLREDAEVLEVG